MLNAREIHTHGRTHNRPIVTTGLMSLTQKRSHFIGDTIFRCCFHREWALKLYKRLVFMEGEILDYPFAVALRKLLTLFLEIASELSSERYNFLVELNPPTAHAPNESWGSKLSNETSCGEIGQWHHRNSCDRKFTVTIFVGYGFVKLSFTLRILKFRML